MVLEAVVKYKLIILTTTTKKSYVIVFKHFGELKLLVFSLRKSPAGGILPHSSCQLILH